MKTYTEEFKKQLQNCMKMEIRINLNQLENMAYQEVNVRAWIKNMEA